MNLSCENLLKSATNFGDDTFCWETNQLCQRPKPKNDMVMMAPDCGSFEGLQKPAFLRRWNTNSVNRGQKILCANVKYYFRVKCSKGNYFCSQNCRYLVGSFKWLDGFSIHLPFVLLHHLTSFVINWWWMSFGNNGVKNG